MKPALTTLLFFLLACSSCSTDVDSDAPSSEGQIRSDVINRFHGMIKYAEAGELENFLSYFDPAGPGSYVDGNHRYTSFDEMAGEWRATWKVLKQDFGEPVTDVQILSDRFVLIVSSSAVATRHRDGVSFQPRPWSVSILWHKRDGEWLIHSFHQASGALVAIEEKSDE